MKMLHMAGGSYTGHSRMRRGDQMDVDQVLTISGTAWGGDSWGTGIEGRKTSLLSKHFMEEILGKVGLKDG